VEALEANKLNTTDFQVSNQDIRVEDSKPSARMAYRPGAGLERDRPLAYGDPRAKIGCPERVFAGSGAEPRERALESTESSISQRVNGDRSPALLHSIPRRECSHRKSDELDEEKNRRRSKGQRYSKLIRASKRYQARLKWEAEKFGDIGCDCVDPDVVNKILERLPRCTAWPYMCAKGHVAVVRNSCQCRVCPMCSAQKADRDFERFVSVFKDMKKPRMFVLGGGRVPHGHLAEHLTLYVKALQQLKRRKGVGLKEVLGGLWSFEIVPKPDGFHVHFHILVDGWIENKGINGRLLETAWAELTPWSSIEKRRSIKIKEITGVKGLRETLKYTLKGALGDKHEWQWGSDHPALSEVVTCLRKRKMSDCWGSVRKILHEKKPEGGDQVLDDGEADLGGVKRVDGKCSVCDGKMIYVEWGFVASGKVPDLKALNLGWDDWTKKRIENLQNSRGPPPCNISKTKEPEDVLPF